MKGFFVFSIQDSGFEIQHSGLRIQIFVFTEGICTLVIMLVNDQSAALANGECLTSA